MQKSLQNCKMVKYRRHMLYEVLIAKKINFIELTDISPRSNRS